MFEATNLICQKYQNNDINAKQFSEHGTLSYAI
jgi:hypothetical protein